MRMTVNLDSSTLTTDLIKTKAILAMTDNMATAEVCHMYIELCQQIAQGIVPDATAKIMNRLKEEYHDSEDRPERHSIAGHMNDSSDMQILKFEKENEDVDFTEPTQDELNNGWMK